MEYFVTKQSVVRKIWGDSDVLLLIFAGASAEFALNKAVDWLYYTGRLPADPLGRLFSTVAYAQRIVFSTREEAFAAIDQITAIHRNLEEKRGFRIPAEAYLDVLFMLIDYSVRAYELLGEKLTPGEKEEIFAVFRRVGARMGQEGLPYSWQKWAELRNTHLENNLAYGALSADLYKQYRKHLRKLRYQLLLQAQSLLVPERVKRLLGLSHGRWLTGLLPFYKLCRRWGADKGIKAVLLPPAYKQQIRNLQMPQSG